MKQLTGSVKKIIYRNEESGFAIFILEEDENSLVKTAVTVKGTFFQLQKEEYITVSGDYVKDPKYGLQFQADHYEPAIPEKMDLLEQYLASGIVKGIGPARAKAIIKVFGKDTIHVLEQDPARLTEVSGIGMRTAELIGRRMQERGKEREILFTLSRYGIGPALGRKICQKYKERTLHVLQSNPYQLIDDIRGVGFQAADKIALENGVSKESPYRIQSGIQYVYKTLCAFGSVYAPMGRLKKESAKTLDVKSEVIEDGFQQLVGKRVLVICEKDHVYRKEDLAMEQELAMRFSKLANRKKRTVSAKALKRLNGNLDETQMNAVRKAAESGLMVLTGGPGTGKTTTTNLIIRYFELTGKQVLLAAPTGRAAKRMKEATGRQASTIHRLLEVTGGEHGMVFQKNETDPLTGDVIIIDEVSMLDMTLATHLLRAVPENAQLILVGDRNQLPSVGAGNVLADLIASGICTVVELKKIYRQASDSDIIANAHHILKGEELKLTNRSQDFFYKSAEDPEKIRELLLHYVADSLPDFTGEPDIQVLAPLRGRALGVEQLNQELQERLNPGKTTIHGFRVGDKVIQTANDYEMQRQHKSGKKEFGVFNGDVGRVTKIDEENEYLYVEFEDNWTVCYDFADLDHLELAYALTIHKSQGSEYPVVVIPVWDYIPMLTTMNLLYTAVTRAKKYILLIGPKKKIYQMIKNVRANDRLTGLKTWLCRPLGNQLPSM